MFSSNIGFRRRTHSESDSSNQLPYSSNRTSIASHRHSLGDSSSTAIKRVVLRKHSGESHGLADRIARSEVENIAGFWSRRLSGQKRSVPSSPSPRQAEFQVNVGDSEWRKETATGSADSSSSSANEADKGKVKVKGPRPLPIIPKRVSTSTTNLIPSLTSSFPETPSPSSSPHEVLPTATPPIRTRSPPLPEAPVQPQLPPTAPLSLKKTKTIESGTRTETESESESEPAKDAVALRYPFLNLPPSKPIKITRPKTPIKAKAEIKELTTKEKEKEKKRFMQLEHTLSKLLGSYKKPTNQSMAVNVFSSSATKLFPPSTVSVAVAVSIPPAGTGIPIPPIPTPNVLPPIYRAHAHAVQMSRQSAAAALRRKSTRKRKTGLARIVMELAKGKQVAAVEAETLQEAAEVREILEQLRQMKAS